MKQMNEQLTVKGNYTAYASPPVQMECSAVWMNDDIDVIKTQWYDAIEIFYTPGMTMERLDEEFTGRGVEQGVFLRWLRDNYKCVYKNGHFMTDDIK